MLITFKVQSHFGYPKAGNIFFPQTFDTAWYVSLPQAIPSVNLPIIQVVLLASVEHKLSFMGAIFLGKHDETRGSDKAAVTDNSSKTVCMSVVKGTWELWKNYSFVSVIIMPISAFSPGLHTLRHY